MTTVNRKPLPGSRHVRHAALLASVILATATVHAQSDLYWNPPDGGSGNWNTTDSAWSTNPAGPGNTTWSSGADTAIFDFSGGAISLQAALGAAGMRFEVDGYSVNAPSLTELELNDDRILHVAAGASAELGPNLRVMAPGVAGDLGFEKTGAGTLVVNGPYGSSASEAYFGSGFGSGNGRLITVSEGTLQVETATLSNSRNIIDIASGASLVANNNLNLGGFSGSGSFSGDINVIIRGEGLDFSGVISGDMAFRHLNAPGAQTFSGSQDNTFTGNIRVNNGTQIFAKDAGVIAMSGSEIWMDGGATAVEVRWENDEQVALTTNLRFDALTSGRNLVNLNGHSERMGNLVLNMSTPSTGRHEIDFGDNSDAQYLWFAGLTVTDSNAPFIYILNFDEALDSLRFDNNPGTGLAHLRFDDGVDLLAATATFDAVNDYWLVTPIPEPSAAWLVALFSFGLLIWHRRRVA